MVLTLRPDFRVPPVDGLVVGTQRGFGTGEVHEAGYVALGIPFPRSCAAVTARKAWADTARVLCRYQSTQRRTPYWSRPHSFFALRKHSSVFQRHPVTRTRSVAVASSGARTTSRRALHHGSTTAPSTAHNPPPRGDETHGGATEG
ncbi:hypothetical protein GCM10010266_58420 [Streptomyces griseomycini]|nr:hypothetical protein GCM10010266_58420 [Streptomyces griseomycini]